MAIDNQPGDLVVLIGHDHFLQELAERHVGQRHSRGDHLLRGFGCDPGQPIAGARRRRLGEQLAQGRKDI